MSIIIENPASRDLVPSELIPIVDHITNIYLQTFGSRIQSVYLLGSATRGEYKPGSSDFDARAIISDGTEEEKERVFQSVKPLQKKYNIAKFELDAYDLAMLDRRDWLQFYLLTDGVCMWGTPYEPTFPLPTTKEGLAQMLASHLLDHYDRMYDTLDQVKTEETNSDPEIWRVYAKRAIRLGNTIAILKTGHYTQNSERMVEHITKSVPEIAESIVKLNQYRKRPPCDLEGFTDLAQEAELVHALVLRYDLKKKSNTSYK